MNITGMLLNIDGRKLTIGDKTVVLRKGVDSAQYLPLLTTEVVADAVEEKGFNMVSEIKPVLPKTAAEDVKGPVDMAPSANVPKLDFNAGPASGGYADVSAGTTAPVKDWRSNKDHDIMRQWAMGHVLLSPALAQCNDAMALSTTQTVERAKKLADQLLDWVKSR